MPTQLQINKAVKTIQSGGVIAYATEAVYGLGCDPDNTDAIERILKFKGRDKKQGFILIASNALQVVKYLGVLNEQEQEFLDKEWQEPTTLILPASDLVSSLVTGGRKTIAVRITTHADTKLLCNALAHPLISTSANLSGLAAIRSRLQLEKIFADKVDYIFPSDLGESTKPSTIINASTGQVLR